MMNIARTDQSAIGRWWWTVDRWTIIALAVLIGFGALLSLAASPAVAERIGFDAFHFVRRQLGMLPIAVIIMFVVSLQSPRDIRRIAVIGFVVALALLALTFMVGVEIKGARRWINFAGLSLQPSEFIKPTFAVVTAWMFSEQKNRSGIPGNLIAILLYLMVAAMLLLQPDLGQAVVITAIWFSQFFLAGLPLILVGCLSLMGGAGLVGAYYTFPHVASRINRFIDPASGDS